MRWPPLAPLGEAANAPPLTPTPPVAIGAIVAGKYRVDGVIGFGGMGIVCAGTHLELATPIAIKFVRPEHGSDERAVARFLTEARAAAKLQSQFACRVMDCGRLPSGSPYIVMEYLVGRDLRSLVSTEGPLGIDDTVSFMLQACEALAEAHVKHIVHRDVKPENLFVAEGPGGAPMLKVLDFGISKQLSPLETQRSLTDSAESVGSPFHMSPEQMIDPANVDSRSDIWSLGVVLYEVLTGQMPFTGESGPQLCANVMTTEPLPPQAHRAEIPEGLVQIMLRCLEKDRELRFRDVGELSLALSEFGGTSAALAAARVQQIFGRVEGTDTPDVVAPNEAEELQAHEPREAFGSIPGVPRRGLGRRVGVTLVLITATGFAAYALRHELVPARLLPAQAESGTRLEPAPEPSRLPSLAPVAPPAPQAPLGPAIAPTPPSPSARPGAATSARPKPKSIPIPIPKPVQSEARPVLEPSSAPPEVAPPPAPVPTETAELPDEAPSVDAGGAVYPTPPPIPELPEPPAPE